MESFDRKSLVGFSLLILSAIFAPRDRLEDLCAVGLFADLVGVVGHLGIHSISGASAGT
jgi:hypothetical protein